MKKYIKAPYVTVGFQNESLFLGFGSIQKEIKNKLLHLPLLKVLDAFLEPKTWKEVERQFSGLSSFSECREVIENNGYLIEDGVYDREDRFSRSKLFYNINNVDPIEAQNRLAHVKVGIIGCGGIGNLVSVNLATAGVRNFLICDNDDVEASNLSRQIMFTEEDIGKLKSQSLAKALKARASYIEVASINRKVTSTDELKEFLEFDLLIVSADKGNVVSIVNEFCVKNKVPFINVGYVNDIAVWGPLVVPGKTGCYSCQDNIAGNGSCDELSALLKKINKDYQAPSVGPVNMLSSSLASVDILRFLIGSDNIQSLNKRIGLWTHNMKFEIQDCHKNKNCKVCNELN